MASLNRVVLIGNLTRDPELTFTPEGTPVAKFGIAVQRPWVKKDSGKQDVDFFNVTAWRKTAEIAAEYISKGSPVALEGRLQFSSWETESGDKRTAVDIVADNIQFLGKKDDTDTGEDKNPEENEVIDLGDDDPFAD